MLINTDAQTHLHTYIQLKSRVNHTYILYLFLAVIYFYIRGYDVKSSWEYFATRRVALWYTVTATIACWRWTLEFTFSRIYIYTYSWGMKRPRLNWSTSHSVEIWNSRRTVDEVPLFYIVARVGTSIGEFTFGKQRVPSMERGNLTD